MPYGSSARCNPRFDITVATTAVAAEQPAVVEIDRGDREHLVAVDQVALLVDRDHAIGVAVERQADLCAGGGHRSAQLLGVCRTARVVDVRAVGRGVQHVDLGAERAQRRRRCPERGAVPAVGNDAYAVEPAALERLGEVRDVVVERAAVLGRDPDSCAIGPGVGHRFGQAASSSSTRASSGSGIFRPPGAKSLMPLSSYEL